MFVTMAKTNLQFLNDLMNIVPYNTTSLHSDCVQYEFEDYFGVKDYNQLVLGDITNTVSSPKAPTSSAGYSFNDYFGVKDYNQFIAVKRVQVIKFCL